MPPFALLLAQLIAQAKTVTPSSGQLNWLNIAAVVLGIIVSVTVIVTGIKSAVNKMIDERVEDKLDAFAEKHITPLRNDFFELKGELRGLIK